MLSTSSRWRSVSTPFAVTSLCNRSARLGTDSAMADAVGVAPRFDTNDWSILTMSIGNRCR